MQTFWEYATYSVTHKDLERTLNNYGRQGWELVGHEYMLDKTYRLIFKRQKSDDPCVPNEPLGNPFERNHACGPVDEEGTTLG